MSEISLSTGSIPLGPLDPSVVHHGTGSLPPADTGQSLPPGKPENRLYPMVNVLIAGGVGGMVGDSAMFPLDTVKTRQQGAPNISKYRTMMRASLTILREEGVLRGIYGGYSPALLGSFPSTMAFFGAYELTKRKLIIDYDVPDTLAHLTAGLLGDLASSFIYVPSEVLKTRLQLQGRYNNPYFYSGYNYRGMIDAFRTIVREEGAGAMFYGYKATLVRDLPFSALQLAFYEEFHSAAQQLVGHGNDMGIGLELVTGALAGGLAGVLTTPLDVVKTRVQTQHPEAMSSMPTVISNSTWEGLKTIYKTEGFSGAFSGVGPRLVWTSVQSSIMLLIYQTTLKLLDSDRRDKWRLAF
jgi:hypothetical protein